MSFIAHILPQVSKREIFLFVGFYIISTLIYYTATWITWGGLESENYAYFNIQEFFASAGVDFIISFFVSIPIWYVTTILLRHNNYEIIIISHLLFLPLYVIICYQAQYCVKSIFGWVMFWGGRKAIWTVYNLILFYIAQFAIINAYNYFQRYKKALTDKFELQKLAMDSELIALKSQLNPHFLHNLFNSINASIPPENEKAKELIIMLSDLFRYQNHASKQEFVALVEEIRFIVKYLELMKVRLKERLNYYIDIPPELYNVKISPMLLQPLVENAIKHGITPKVEPSFLLIKIIKSGERHRISIEDTGIGFDLVNSLDSKGLGLNNTEKRLKKLYNSALIIEPNIPTGTIISFHI